MLRSRSHLSDEVKRTRGSEKKALNPAYFYQKNAEIIDGARDPKLFVEMLHRFVVRDEALNTVNVTTILHRAARMRRQEALPREVIKFLAATLREGDFGEKLDAQHVGNAPYLRGLDGLENIHQPAAAVTAER